MSLRSKFHTDHWYFCGQILVILILICITRAFALVSLFEFLLWLIFLFYRPLRLDFLKSLSVPPIRWLFLFWAWIALAMLWSEADWVTRFEEWFSWRKLLLVPMSFVLFKNSSIKNVLIWVLILVSALYMAFSWLGWFEAVALDRPPNQLLENHSTQGFFFALAAYCCALYLIEGKFSPILNFFLIVLAIGFIGNILFILTGKTSYLALIALSLVFLLCI
jgi:hypothetical protein